VEIPKAIRASDYILIFLSKNSVSKRGYVQDEFKRVLEVMREIPDGTIYAIQSGLMTLRSLPSLATCSSVTFLKRMGLSIFSGHSGLGGRLFREHQAFSSRHLACPQP
jgi:hypothetical protein